LGQNETPLAHLTEKVDRHAMPNKSTAASRIQLAYRVSESLKHLNNYFTLEVVNSGDVVIGAQEDSSFRGDFALDVSNIRLRILLLVELDQTALRSESTKVSCLRILMSNPETYACVPVADDSELSATLYELGSLASRTLHNGNHSVDNQISPLDQTIIKFIGGIVPPWRVSDFNSLEVDQSPNYVDEISRIAHDARISRQESRPNIPEKRKARESLDLIDEDWLVQIAHETMTESQSTQSRSKRKHT
jgi:hypothetical protein